MRVQNSRFIQRINTLNSSETRDEFKKEIEEHKKQLGKSFNEDNYEHLHKEKSTLLDDYLRHKPSTFSTKYVEQEADKILISFRKVATITKFKATGKNKRTRRDCSKRSFTRAICLW